MKAGALLLIAAGAGVLGCAPALLWFGHDPARSTRWELRAKNGQTWLQARAAARDRGPAPPRRSPPFDEIVVAEMAFASGGRLAFPARLGARWHMVVDLKAGPPWDGLAAPRFDRSGAHLAHAALRAGRWRVVQDGRPGPELDGVVDGTLTFSPDGRRLGYAAVEGGCVRVRIDHTPAPGCFRGVRALFVGDDAGQDAFLVEAEPGLPAVVKGPERQPLPGLVDFSFAPAGGSWVAVLQPGERARLLLSGAPVAEAEEIAEAALSASGALAYARREGSAWHLVVHGRSQGPFAWVGPVTFSPDGRRAGYVAGASDGRELVVIDGQVRGSFAAAEGLVFSGDGRRQAFAARRGDQMGIVCDGRFFPFDLVVETSIAFSADGRHWAALVGDRGRRQLWIAVDGARRLPFDSEELFGAAAEGAGDAARLRGWIAAELEHHLRARKGPEP